MSRTDASLRPEPRWAELDTSLAETEDVGDWDGGRIDLAGERPREEVGEDRSWIRPLLLCLSPVAAFALGGLLVLLVPRSSEPASAMADTSDDALEAPGLGVLIPTQPAAPPAVVEQADPGFVLAASARVHRPPPPPEFEIDADVDAKPSASTPSRRRAAAPAPAVAPAEPQASPAAELEPESKPKPETDAKTSNDGQEPPLPGSKPAGSTSEEPGSEAVAPDVTPDEPAEPASLYADLPEYPS